MEKIVRRAIGTDSGMIGELLRGWLNETDFGYPGVCEYSYLWLADFIYRYPCFVVEMDGEVVATIGMRLGHLPWNNEVAGFFCEFFIVHKQYRGNGVAKSLIDEVKKMSDETKTPIFLGIMTGNLADQKDKFLEICGLKYAGGNFVYGV